MEGNNLKNIIKVIINNFQSFAYNFLYIRSKNNSVSRFIFNKEQIYINNILNDQKKRTGKVRALILKGRQIGSTTYVSSRCYHHSISHIGSKSLVLCHRQSATNNIFDMILRYYQNSPKFLQPKALISNYKYINFKELNSSYSFATAGGSEVGRSETIQFFHGSEVAFWKNSDNHLSSILMSVSDSNDTEVVLESTSNGPEGLFYNMCMEAESGNSEYKLIFLPWYWHEEYTSNEKCDFSEEWLEYKKNHKLSTKQLAWAYLKNKNLCATNLENTNKPSYRFHKEFPATIHEAFLNNSESKLIPINILLSKSLKGDFCLFNKDRKEEFLLNKLDKPIILGVDVARGGGDFSWIIDRQGNYIGFNLNEKINTADTMELTGIIAKNIDKLSPLQVCIDAGGGGIGVYDRLCELGYKNCLKLVNFGEKAFNGRKYFNKRSEMWGLLGDFIKEDGFIVSDNMLLQQISTIEYFYNSMGQLRIESKDEIKKRLKGSPDGGDACALTFACDSNNTKVITQKIVPNYESFDPYNW